MTAKIGQRYLHSRYNPQKEAKQFLDQWKTNNNIDKKNPLVVLEPGLGYLTDLLIQSDFTNILIIYFHKQCFEYGKEHFASSHVMHYLFSNASELNECLDQFLPNRDFKKIQFLEWPAGVQNFSNVSKEVNLHILNFIKIKQGSELTGLHFSYPTFINGIRNFLRYDYSFYLADLKQPVILAASGPSLEEHIDDIKLKQNQYIIAALPSSAKILTEYGIQWDILISTDPGYYASEHLKYSNRSFTVSPITAKASSFCQYIGMNQNSYVERTLLNESELPFLPEMGTVAASALHLLSHLWHGDIFIAGLDFSLKDIKMHASPHSFDPIICQKAQRLSPYQNMYFDRAFQMTDSKSGNLRRSKSMDTYSAWFKNQKMRGNIYQIEPVPINLNINTVRTLPAGNGEKTLSVQKNTLYPGFSVRKERIREFIKALETGFAANNDFYQDFLINVLPKIDKDETDILDDKMNSLIIKMKRLCH